MNSVNLTGNLGKVFELKYTQGNTAVATGQIAVRSDYKNKETGEYSTDWIRAVIFGKGAEVFTKYTGKGSKVELSGHLHAYSYDNKQGQRVYVTEVIVDKFGFLDSKKNTQDVPEITDDDVPF